MNIVRFISACLTLCLLATSVMSASLRFDPGTGQFVTICAGGQSVTVELDHTGAPMDLRHHCPDCVSVAILTPRHSEPTLHMIETRLSAAQVSRSQTSVISPKPSARAPPVVV